MKILALSGIAWGLSRKDVRS